MLRASRLRRENGLSCRRNKIFQKFSVPSWPQNVTVKCSLPLSSRDGILRAQTFWRQVFMKKCSYCEREKTDEALHCKECGTEFEREVVDSESHISGLHDEVKTVTIRTFSYYDSAELARSNLEAHGVQCWVNADDCGGMYLNLTAANGVRLVGLAS